MLKTFLSGFMWVSFNDMVDECAPFAKHQVGAVAG